MNKSETFYKWVKATSLPYDTEPGSIFPARLLATEGSNDVVFYCELLVLSDGIFQFDGDSFERNVAIILDYEVAIPITLHSLQLNGTTFFVEDVEKGKEAIKEIIHDSWVAGSMRAVYHSQPEDDRKKLDNLNLAPADKITFINQLINNLK